MLTSDASGDADLSNLRRIKIPWDLGIEPRTWGGQGSDHTWGAGNPGQTPEMPRLFSVVPPEPG